jgi:hypothetical protein
MAPRHRSTRAVLGAGLVGAGLVGAGLAGVGLAGVGLVGALASLGGCIPDVNVTGIRGEGGSGSGASGTGASGGTGGSGSGASGGTGAGASGGSGASGGAGGSGGEIYVYYRNKGPNFELHQGFGDCITMECDSGDYILSGGGAWDGSDVGVGYRIVLDKNHPSAVNEWEMCGYSDQEDTYEWYVEGICTNLEPTYVSEPGTHPGTGDACITATCPPGLHVVGGGGTWDGGIPPAIRLDSSQATAADAWTICGYSTTTGHAWAAEAVCAPLEIEIVSTTPTKHPGGDQCIQATCPVGKKAVSGGGDWGHSGAVVPNANRPRTNQSGPFGWTLCAGSQAVPADHLWSVQVLCL